MKPEQKPLFDTLFQGSDLRGRALLEHIRDFIKTDPEHFDMDNWGVETSCGTEGCISGWAIICANQFTEGREIMGWIQKGRPDPVSEGAKLLGLTPSEAGLLFHSQNWDNDIKAPYFEHRNDYYSTVDDERRLEARKKMVCGAVEQINRMIERKKTTDPVWYNYGEAVKETA